MRSRNINSVIVTALVWILVAVTACETIQYRDIQGEFVDAVAADNAWSVSPFGASATLRSRNNSLEMQNSGTAKWLWRK